MMIPLVEEIKGKSWGWVALEEGPDGALIVHRPTPGQLPGRLNGRGNLVLVHAANRKASAFGDLLVLVALEEGARLNWLSTVDCYANGGGLKARFLGPGIDAAGTVRAWIEPGSNVIVLTTGSVETGVRAVELFRRFVAGEEGENVGGDH